MRVLPSLRGGFCRLIRCFEFIIHLCFFFFLLSLQFKLLLLSCVCGYMSAVFVVHLRCALTFREKSTRVLARVFCPCMANALGKNVPYGYPSGEAFSLGRVLATTLTWPEISTTSVRTLLTHHEDGLGRDGDARTASKGGETLWHQSPKIIIIIIYKCLFQHRFPRGIKQ